MRIRPSQRGKFCANCGELPPESSGVLNNNRRLSKNELIERASRTRDKREIFVKRQGGDIPSARKSGAVSWSHRCDGPSLPFVFPSRGPALVSPPRARAGGCLPDFSIVPSNQLSRAGETSLQLALRSPRGFLFSPAHPSRACWRRTCRVDYPFAPAARASASRARFSHSAAIPARCFFSKPSALAASARHRSACRRYSATSSTETFPSFR